MLGGSTITIHKNVYHQWYVSLRPRLLCHCGLRTSSHCLLDRTLLWSLQQSAGVDESSRRCATQASSGVWINLVLYGSNKTKSKYKHLLEKMSSELLECKKKCRRSPNGSTKHDFFIDKNNGKGATHPGTIEKCRKCGCKRWAWPTAHHNEFGGRGSSHKNQKSRKNRKSRKSRKSRRNN